MLTVCFHQILRHTLRFKTNSMFFLVALWLKCSSMKQDISWQWADSQTTSRYAPVQVLCSSSVCVFPSCPQPPPLLPQWCSLSHCCDCWWNVVLELRRELEEETAAQWSLVFFFSKTSVCLSAVACSDTHCITSQFRWFADDFAFFWVLSGKKMIVFCH